MNGEPGDSTSWWTLSLVSKLFRPGNDGRVSFFFPKIVTHVHCKDHQTSFKYPTWKTGVLKAQVQLIQNFSFQYVSSALESASSGWIFAEQESSHDSDPSILPCDSSSMRRLQTFTNSLGSSKGRIRANKFFTCQAILMYYSLDFAGVLPLETWKFKGTKDQAQKPTNPTSAAKRCCSRSGGLGFPSKMSISSCLDSVPNATEPTYKYTSPLSHEYTFNMCKQSNRFHGYAKSCQ